MCYFQGRIQQAICISNLSKTESKMTRDRNSVKMTDQSEYALGYSFCGFAFVVLSTGFLTFGLERKQFFFFK